MFLSFVKSKSITPKIFLFLSLFILIPINFSFAQKGGYVDKLSVAQGGTITFYLSSEVPKFKVSFFKLEKAPIWIADSDSVTGGVQSVRDSAYWYGANWSPSFQYQIPTTWRTGIYRAQFQITSDTSAAIIFIVKEDSLGSPMRRRRDPTTHF